MLKMSNFWLRHQAANKANNNKPLNLVANTTRKANNMNNNSRKTYKPMPIRKRKSTRKNRKLY